MLLEKVFEVTINISNPINFCTDKERHAFTELNNIYANKCYMGSYIIDIINILQISSCRIVNTNSSSDGIIDVKFLANVFILNIWDVLIGVKIAKNQSLLVGKYNKPQLEIDVTFRPTEIQANSLLVGQLVPVRVIQAVHKPKEGRIAIAAVLLTCDKKSVTYRVKGEILKTAIPEIQLIFKNIIDELKMRSNIDKDRIMFFESLIYSYKNMPKTTEKITFGEEYWEGPKNNISNNKSVNIFDTLGMDLTGFWSRPLGICRSCPLITVSQEKPIDYVLTAPHLMIIELAKNILTFLTAIREFSELYTPELIKSHENIWNMMRQVQLN